MIPDERAQRQARDAALVVRIRQDDASALTELARVYLLPLAAVAEGILGSNAFVDDVLQEVFVSLWMRRTTLDIPENVAGYLHRLVRNRVLNVLRHEQSQRRVATMVGMLQEHSVQNDAERSLRDADTQTELRAAMAQIPESPRQVLSLSLGGLSYAEIADTLGITVASVRTLMYRATKRLTRHLLDRDP